MFNYEILKNWAFDFWSEFMKFFSFPPQFEKYLDFVPVFLIGFLVTFILTPFIGHLAKKYNIVYIPHVKRNGRDFENEEKAMHEGIIPALGGVAVLIPFLIFTISAFHLDNISLPLLVATGILLLLGIFDDIINLPAKVQFIFQLLASLVIAVSILDLQSFSLFGLSVPMDIFKFQPVLGDFAFSITFPGDLILFAWLAFCINAFKWTAGSPGLIEGNTFIISTLIFIISVRFQVLFTSTASIFLAGSIFAFLIFAYPPPLIMTGSSGKSVYGLLLCTLGLMSQTKFATTLLLLLFPILDAVFVLVRRYIEYKPKNPLDLMKISGTTHFHHHLLKMGFSQKKVFWTEMLVTLGISSLAVVTTGAYRYLLVILAVIAVISIILFTNSKAKQKEEEQKESSEARYSY
jgi:UDP-GlcNAc:undecaprenyl-phosphate GlcNAc-1-phosphate transferase